MIGPEQERMGNLNIDLSPRFRLVVRAVRVPGHYQGCWDVAVSGELWT